MNGEPGLEGLLVTLTAGLRRLEPDGKLTNEPGDPEILGAVAHLVVVDLEMSGPNAQVHEVLDIGGVRAQLAPGVPEVEAWGARVKPRHIGNAVPGALKVVGYSSKAWKDAAALDEALDRFASLGRDSVITGWGIRQDMAFLVESYRRTARPWPFATVALDVQPIARKLLRDTGDVDRFNLGHVADRLGIGRMGEHGALADAYATYDVLVKLLERARGGERPVTRGALPGLARLTAVSTERTMMEMFSGRGEIPHRRSQPATPLLRQRTDPVELRGRRS